MADEDRKRKRKREPGMVMRFDLLRGSLSSLCTTTAAAAGAVDICMDAAVWGGMPDEVIWEVLRYVPVAKHSQWQLVSRKWRQVLTSAHFQTKLAPLSVVACVWLSPLSHTDNSSTSSSSNANKACQWEVDLSTVVPSSFWREDDGYDADPDLLDELAPWSVVAAAHGLVCITNLSESRLVAAEEEEALHPPQQAAEEASEPGKPWANRYCVVNPVARTCVVLPPPRFKIQQWLPPTSTTVAFLGHSSTNPSVWVLARFHLAPAPAAASGWVAKRLPCGPDVYSTYVYGSWAMLGDHTYRYNARDQKVMVTAPCTGRESGGGGGHGVVAVLDVPSAALPGVDASSTMRILHTRTYCGTVLVAHRGAVYFVAQQLKLGNTKQMFLGTFVDTIP